MLGPGATGNVSLSQSSSHFPAGWPAPSSRVLSCVPQVPSALHRGPRGCPSSLLANCHASLPYDPSRHHRLLRCIWPGQGKSRLASGARRIPRSIDIYGVDPVTVEFHAPWALQFKAAHQVGIHARFHARPRFQEPLAWQRCPRIHRCVNAEFSAAWV
jgi:hypothetical protein